MTSADRAVPDMDEYRRSYVEMFGEVPPLPAAKLKVGAEVDPEALRLGEALWAHAFFNDLFDAKITQLMLFGMLLSAGGGAARWHAPAARGAGVSWEELYKVSELAGALAALGPLNNGGSVLEELRDDEERE